MDYRAISQRAPQTLDIEVSRILDLKLGFELYGPVVVTSCYNPSINAVETLYTQVLITPQVKIRQFDAKDAAE